MCVSVCVFQMKGCVCSLWRKGNPLISNEAVESSLSVFYPRSTGRNSGLHRRGLGGCCRGCFHHLSPAQDLYSPCQATGIVAIHTEEWGGGGPVSQSPRTQFIRTHPLLPWRFPAHRAWLIVPKFTQASSTIRQDEFSSWSIMRPGRPESIWQPPRGRQSPGRAHCCHKFTRPPPLLGRRSGRHWGALPLL